MQLSVQATRPYEAESFSSTKSKRSEGLEVHPCSRQRVTKNLGINEYFIDLRSMMGTPKTCLGKVIGPTGKYIEFIWRYVAPAEAVVSS
jgi:hypothetical protein